jgi:preprotein translocase subunit SecG
MVSFLLALHIFVSLSLIFIVLIQGGKGAQMGAAFGGGSSQTVFGSRGASTFLGKMTTVVAVVFMITSLLLAMASVRGGSVVKQAPAPGQTAPQGMPAGGTSPLPSSPVDESGDFGSPVPPGSQAPAGQGSPVPPPAPQESPAEK